MPAPKIMVVEDEGIVSIDIRNILTRLGYQVTGSAFTGEEAIEKFTRGEPDIIFMDIGLKGVLDGIETAKIMLRIKPVSIVFLTGFSDPTTLQRAGTVESAGYLIKPVTEEDLKKTLAKIRG